MSSGETDTLREIVVWLSIFRIFIPDFNNIKVKLQDTSPHLEEIVTMKECLEEKNKSHMSALGLPTCIIRHNSSGLSAAS